jgi:hypothetical protein
MTLKEEYAQNYWQFANLITGFAIAELLATLLAIGNNSVFGYRNTCLATHSCLVHMRSRIFLRRSCVLLSPARVEASFSERTRDPKRDCHDLRRTGNSGDPVWSSLDRRNVGYSFLASSIPPTTGARASAAL